MNKAGICKLCNTGFVYCDKSQPGIYCSRLCKQEGLRGELKITNCKGCSIEIQWTGTRKRSYCKVECMNDQTIDRTSEIIRENFEKKVIKQDGCWGWNGMTSPNGYGRMNKNNKKIGAHQVSWIIHHGNIPKGMNVLHRCNNAICTNYQHLYIGTQKQNIADAVRAGRARGFRTVLNEAEVIEIKKLIKEGYSIKQLAAKYKVNGTMISNIRRNKTWRHITID